MVRVYRLPPVVMMLILAAVVALILVSLPIFLGLAALFVVARAVSALFLPSRKEHARFGQTRESFREPGLSDTISNKRIGDYRIKTNPDDPTVIEVIDAD